MSVQNPCPRCHGHTWYVQEGQEVWQKCLCGYYHPVVVDKNGLIVRYTQPITQMTLPKKGSKISKCLGIIALMQPQDVTTKMVASQLEYSTSDVASHLMVLQHKGLVEKIIDCRGKTGGSTWRLSSRALTLLKL